jgi:hypothetical protein
VKLVGDGSGQEQILMATRPDETDSVKDEGS